MKRASAPIEATVVEAMQKAMLDDLAGLIGDLDPPPPPSDGAAARLGPRRGRIDFR